MTKSTSLNAEFSILSEGIMQVSLMEKDLDEVHPILARNVHELMHEAYNMGRKANHLDINSANKILRRALKWYANSDSYWQVKGNTHTATYDFGKRAKNALKRDKGFTP